MAGTIGIKIANGDFYPIMTEGKSTVKKRLVLTTVHDGQENVQIDLYRSVSKSIQDAQYIGSLVVEEIMPRPRGEASIEMVISCSADGMITADARDLDAGDGEHNTLSVSLKTLESNQRSHDFDLDNKTSVAASRYEQTESTEEEKRKTPWLIIIFAVLFLIIVLALLWLFFLGGRDTQLARDIRDHFSYEQDVAPPPPPPPPPEPPPPPPPPPEPPPPPPDPVVEEVPIIQAPVDPPPVRPQVVERKRPPAPVSSYKVPAVIPKNGVAYQIRWGDTLWDISEAFYRNPWLYPRIARHNNIRNPDHIIAGRTIRIPPKN